MSIRSLLSLAALCLGSLGVAQYPGTSPIVTKKAPYKKVIGAPASTINTLSFSPQIKEVTGLVQPEEIENRFNHLVYDTVEQNTINLGGLLPSQSPLSIKKQFPAIGATGWQPPDPDLAVGKDHIVAVVNVSLAFFTKNGTKIFEQQLGNGGFFSGMEVTDFVFDPKCFYDAGSDRFFVVGLEQADGPPTVSKILVAVSDDGNPTGTWFRYRIEAKQTVNSVDYWLDYPGFGFGKDGLLCTGNMFGFTGGYNGVQYIAMKKAEMLTGAAPVISYFSLPGGSVQVMRTPEALDTIYAVNWTGFSTAMVHAITDIATTPVLTTKDVAIPTFRRPVEDAESTAGHLLDSLDGRMLNCQVRNGRLYTTHTVALSNSDGTNASRWYEFNLNGWPAAATPPTLRQAGTVGIGSGIHYWMPAISVNAVGDIALVFSRASSTITADYMAASRRSNDPLGFMNTPILLAKSVGGSYGGAGGTNRWGDYFGNQVDPVDGTTFWGIGMIANAGGGWQTIINSFKVTTPFAGGPATIAKFEGGTATGTLTNVTASDNLYYKVNSVSVNRTGQVASAVATFNIPQSNIATLNFTMETAAATYVTASMFIWDWSTSKWVYVGATPQTTSDKVWTLGISAPFGKYVNATTKQAKILVRSIMPFSTVRPAVPFTLKIDQLKFAGTN